MQQHLLNEIVQNIECALAINTDLRISNWENQTPDWEKLIEQTEFLISVLYAVAHAKKNHASNVDPLNKTAFRSMKTRIQNSDS